MSLRPSPQIRRNTLNMASLEFYLRPIDCFEMAIGIVGIIRAETTGY